jgi:hypothetical protein
MFAVVVLLSGECLPTPKSYILGLDILVAFGVVGEADDDDVAFVETSEYCM